MPHKSLNERALGIDLRYKSEVQLFEWLLACLLFGRPIRQNIAQRAYQLMIQADITSLDKLLGTKWNKLVAILDDARYVRYDYSTATKLLEVARSLKERFGSVKALIEQSPNLEQLQTHLMSFKGIGPGTAQIFMKCVAPIWYAEPVDHDYRLAIKATRILRRHGFEAYLVGGAVRDLWLGVEPKDFDLATNATPDEIDALGEFTHSYHSDDARYFGISRICLENSKEMEIATFRKDIRSWRGRKQTEVVFADLEDDVLRRDLTIDGLALDPITRQVIDYVDGISDLYDQQVRFIGDARVRIHEDPLRLLRAVRIKNHLSFKYHPSARHAIAQAVRDGYLSKISRDKLRLELSTMLLDVNRVQALLDMENLGILQSILPEVAALCQVEQPLELHGNNNVWQHTLSVMRHLPPNPDFVLVWAALLHDIGKKFSSNRLKTINHESIFPEHATIGADMAQQILRRLHFTKNDRRAIGWIIQNHMAVDKIMFMPKKQQNDMFKNASFEDLLELYRADESLAFRSKRPHLISQTLREIEQLWHKYLIGAKSLKKDLGINKSWVIEQLGVEFDLSDSVLINKTLQYLDDYYQEHGVTDIEQYKTEARYYLLKYIAGSADQLRGENNEFAPVGYNYNVNH